MALSNPLLDFERLLFVKRFTQETYPDVCLNHMPWVSRPGGDLCVLSARRNGPALFPALADWAQENRVRPEPDSPYPAVEAAIAKQIEANWETWRTLRDAWYEAVFQAIVP